MITLITGAPGTGKSNALVSLLAELGKDRPLFVNGIPELKIPHVELHNLAEWPTAVPDGACIIGDECQGTFRPRGPGQKVPDHVSLLETHRHRGLDFYFITQGPNLLDVNVRALVGRHVHLRDLGILGRWWYEWPECADNCRTSWKNAPIKKRYRLDKAAQAKYKSASIHVKPIRSIPWMLAVMVLALVAVGVTAWKTYSMIGAKMAPAKPDATGQSGLAKNTVNPSSTSSQAQTPVFIDDRIAWNPRISSLPESAPAYDAIRTVVVMPLVHGCVEFKGRARCFTQQGTDAGLSHHEARQWLAQPRFNPYKVETTAQAPTPPAAEKNVSEPPAGGFTLIGDASRPATAAGRGPHAAASEAPRRPLANGRSAPALDPM